MAETIKSVNDLGVAAYLMMHGYAVVGKTGKSFYFRCLNETESKEFDVMIWEYGPPNEFYLFDSCLMFLKKVNEQVPANFDPKIHKVVSDLGSAAYVLLNECREESHRLGARVIGKRGKDVYFLHPEANGNVLQSLSWGYFQSQFQKYDSALQALKKFGEYMPAS